MCRTARFIDDRLATGRLERSTPPLAGPSCGRLTRKFKVRGPRRARAIWPVRKEPPSVIEPRRPVAQPPPCERAQALTVGGFERCCKCGLALRERAPGERPRPLHGAHRQPEGDHRARGHPRFAHPTPVPPAPVGELWRCRPGSRQALAGSCTATARQRSCAAALVGERRGQRCGAFICASVHAGRHRRVPVSAAVPPPRRWRRVGCVCIFRCGGADWTELLHTLSDRPSLR